MSPNFLAAMEKSDSRSFTTPDDLDGGAENAQEGGKNISGSKPYENIPRFAGQIDSSSQSEALEQFIDKHRGKIVHFNIEIDPLYSKRTGQGNYIGFSNKPCTSASFFLECISFGITVTGNNHLMAWHGQNIMLAGYFEIKETVEMHQGTQYILKSLSPDKILSYR